MKQVIHTEHAPAAIGPYSQAVKIGDLLFTSGQIPVDPATGAVPEGGRPRPGSPSATSRPSSMPLGPTWAR